MARDQIAQALNKQDEKRSTIKLTNQEPIWWAPAQTHCLSSHVLFFEHFRYTIKSVPSRVTRSLPWLKKVCIYIPVGEGEGEGEHSTTVEPRCNERPRDWQNLLLWRDFVISRFFFVYFTITETKKIFRNTEDFTCPCYAGAGLFFRAKEEISRTHEGGACSGDPCFPFTPPI